MGSFSWPAPRLGAKIASYRKQKRRGHQRGISSSEDIIKKGHGSIHYPRPSRNDEAGRRSSWGKSSNNGASYTSDRRRIAALEFIARKAYPKVESIILCDEQ